ncbi:MAG: tetratricopeptide repeat protein [Acidobacteria bacterium]|nr:tetratricopeptide repeat protein [Acidobacteriota bacterium]
MMKLKFLHIPAAIAVFILLGAGTASAQTAGGASTSPAAKKATKKPTKTTRKPAPKTKTKTPASPRKTTTTPSRTAQPAVSRDAVYYFDHAMYGCGANDLDCKIENFTKAINLSPRLPAPYFNRAVVYYQKKFYNSAVADYTKVIELDEQNAFAAYNNRAWTFCQMGLFDKALDDAERALELKPDYPEALDTRGTAYMGKGEYRLALDDFNKAIRLAPSNPELYRSRAALYRKTGKAALAQADERKLVELGGKF